MLKENKKFYNTRDIMRRVKKNNSKIQNKSANKSKADDGEFVEKIFKTGPPVMSSVKLTGKYTPNNTSATRSATKIPRYEDRGLLCIGTACLET